MFYRYLGLVFMVSGNADLITSCHPVNQVYGQVDHIFSEFTREPEG